MVCCGTYSAHDVCVCVCVRYKVVLTVGNGDKVTVVDRGITATVLFNPWSSGEYPAMSSPILCALAPSSPAEDSTYFSNTSELSEYVLNNQGRIWVGSADSNYGRPWQFAQFTKQALEVALYLLDFLPQAVRADPVQVSPNPVMTLQTDTLNLSMQVARHISAWVNVQDDDGILVGNWSGDYTGGVSPLSWTGSSEILAQFLTDKKPVQYAQCWVFSGVQTTCECWP